MGTDIRSWLDSIGLAEYADLFVRNGLDLDVLPDLTEAHLHDLGVPLGHRLKILKAITKLEAATPVPTSDPNPQPSSTDSLTAGERRQLTVMFCDLVGSTALSEKLDPEELRALLHNYRTRCGEVISRYEGFVARYVGDGILTYFGWPKAHEEDADRALRAALEIVQAVKGASSTEPLSVRIGIATGPVVVGEQAGVGDQSKLAVGSTPNLAARLQGLAAADQIVIASSTRRLVGNSFELSDLGEHELKGISEPVRAWRVMAVRAAASRFEASHGAQVTPLAGRELEIGLLLDRWHQAQEGEGQVVLLSGEPGIGKSRILSALRERLEPQGAGTLRFQCSPYYVNSAFYPTIDNFERALKFGRDETPESKLDKLEAMIVTQYGRPLIDVRFIATILSIACEERYGALVMTPQKQKDETLRALVDLTDAAARKQPSVMLYEDVHWADPTSLEVLDLIIDRVRNIPLLIVLTYRPEFQSRWSGHGHVTGLDLSKLTRAQSSAIVSKLAGGKELPADLLGQILAKTDGVPLYVEELTKAILESGELKDAGDHYDYAGAARSATIPATLRDSLMARLDRFMPVKKIAQIGAAIGREFSYELIAAVATHAKTELDSALNQLTESGLAFRRGTPPDAVYTFKHALVQDAAYDSLLKTRRQALHAKIARVLEDNFPATKDTDPELLAHHFSRSADWEKALEYFLKSAAKAVKAFGLREALRFYEEALAAVRQLGAKIPVTALMEIHSARSDLFFGVSDFSNAQAEADELLSVARHIGDRTIEASALVQGAIARVWREDFSGAVARATEAIEVSEAAGAQAALAGALFVTGMVNALTGEHEKADEEMGRALSISRSERDFNRQGTVLFFIGALRGWHGRYRESVALGTEGVRLGREQQLVVPLIRCLWTQGIGYSGLGDYEAALAALREGLALAEKLGDEAFLCRYLNTLGWLHIECGDLDPGLELNARSLELARRDRHATGAERAAFTLLNEGDAFMTRGDLAAASEKLGEALQIVRHPPPSRWMTWRYSTHCYVSLGELALARGDPATADRFADQSLEIALPTRSRKFESRAWRVKGESSWMRRHWDEAEEALRHSLAIAQEIDEPRQLWKSHVSIGRLNRELKRVEAAARSYASASDILGRLLENVRDPGLRAGLESRVRGLRES